MARKLAAVMFLLGAIQANCALSLGLGALQVQSFLNEPFKGTIDLLDMGGLHPDEVQIRLASRDDFDKIGLERPYFLNNITFEVFAKDKGTAGIIVSSSETVLEPYLDFIVEARWPSGRLLREYTVFIDPPSFAEVETVVVSASQRMDQIEGRSAPIKNNDDVISSGTSIEIRRSGLAPDAMPQRGYNSTAASVPESGSRYMISRQDTLWRIASLAKPQGASVQQTMLDIQRLNPEAFVNGNINRVKAGYIVYLPSASEISPLDASSALAEVREQNAAWREGRDISAKAPSGPLLTISTDSDDVVAEAVDTVKRPSGVEERKVDPESSPVAKVKANNPETLPSLADDMQERLFVAEQQLETLQRIVSLKDDQIVALQSALVDAGAVDADSLVIEAAGELPAGGDQAISDQALVEAQDNATMDSAETVGSEAAVLEDAPGEAPKVFPTLPVESEASDNELNPLWYLLGAIALCVLTFLFVRRRRPDEGKDGDTPYVKPIEDVFAAVELKDQDLNVEESEEEENTIPATSPGESYNDHESASHTEAAEVLADVDIYLVYGRHSQAIDLLNSAIAIEPNNPLYRRKLAEIDAHLNDSVGSGSAAETLISIGADEDNTDSQAAAELSAVGVNPDKNAPGLSPNPLELMADEASSFEVDLSGLDAGGLQLATDEEDDLHFSDDNPFTDRAGPDNEELLVTADGYGLMTKLDLARAYIDMGDDEGAREILEEVIADGTDEIKAEASVLLNRIGQ